MNVASNRAVVVALGLLVSAGSSSVSAFCVLPGTTFTSNYFDAPIGQDPVATAGTFWGIGQFNPASPGGSDNGNAPSATWLRYTPGGGFYLAADWSGDALYDGCVQDPPNPQPARMAAAWTTSDGTDSYFVALCATEDASGTFNTLVDIPAAPMARVPRPVIRSAHRIGGGVLNLTIGIEPSSGGVHNTGGCALAVTGFRIYYQYFPRNTPVPGASRSPADGWTLAGSGSPGGADVTVPLSCGAAEDLYLMATLVLDGNVELKHGSRNSTRVACGPNVANPGEDEPRIIRKPKNVKGQ